MSRFTESDRAAARAAAAAFGCPPEQRPPAARYWDRDETTSVTVLTCADRPVPGYTTWSTIGLHHVPNVLEGQDVRVELAGVASSDVEEFPNVLATAAFYVMKDGWLCGPGVVFPGLLDEYDLSPNLQHVLWMPPSPWQGLGRVDVGDVHAHWLMAFPISESERQLLLEVGFDRFEQMLEDRDVPYFDVEREPVA